MIDAPLGDRTAWKPEWPALEELYIPIGEAKVARAGTRVTVLTYGRNVPMCLAAAEELAGEGIDAEIVDLRSLHPYDWDAIAASVRKTAIVREELAEAMDEADRQLASQTAEAPRPR